MEIMNANAIRKLPVLPYHHSGKERYRTISICTQLVSESHLDIFCEEDPRIPKSDFSKYREGLIIGSACEAGELYQAILNDKSEERIARIVRLL